MSTEHLKMHVDWKLVWSQHIPPKIKNCLWRSHRNCLPTRQRLISKGVQCPMQCCFRPQSIENEWHIFIDCEKAKDIWKAASFWYHIHPRIDKVDGFNEIIWDLLQYLHAHDQNQLAIILSTIWRNRNNKIWNNAESSPSITVSLGFQFFAEWLSVCHIKQQLIT